MNNETVSVQNPVTRSSASQLIFLSIALGCCILLLIIFMYKFLTIRPAIAPPASPDSQIIPEVYRAKKAQHGKEIGLGNPNADFDSNSDTETIVLG